MKLKYRLVPQGAANGVVPLNWVFLEKKDIENCGLTDIQAVKLIGKELGSDCAAVNIMDMDAITVTSDGIIAPGAVVGLASVDHGMINEEYGYLHVTEIPFTEQLIAEEPHMKLWLTEPYRGKKLFRGPNTKDRGTRSPHNENMTMSGRICNNNVGSEVMNMLEMTEILGLFFGMRQLMIGGDVLIGKAGPVVSVGIGMIVSERHGRIFGGDNLGAYRAGMTAHNSGEYAKTVKSDVAAIAAPKSVLAEYALRAMDIGLVPGRDIGSSPANLCLAKAYGKPIDYDNITDRAWIELNSLGITREFLEDRKAPLSREEVIAQADSIIPGLDGASRYSSDEVVKIGEIDL